MKIDIKDLKPDKRIAILRKKTLNADRFLSLEQAKIITGVYQEHRNLPVITKRSLALARSLSEMPIAIDPVELIVGNRTPEIRSGVVFPEAGLAWVLNELESLPERPQDPFKVRQEDADYFREFIEPFWRGKTLEDEINDSYGNEIKAIAGVVKINQKDHAQGHICPDVGKWLKYGPAGLQKLSDDKLSKATAEKKDFYEAVSVTLKASSNFIKRYSDLAVKMADNQPDIYLNKELIEIAEVCRKISVNPPESFREAIQSLWFLFVILQMESNASSFSPGRMDQYLYPFLINDLNSGRIDMKGAFCF